MKTFRHILVALAGACLLWSAPARAGDPTDFMSPTLDGGGGLFRVYSAEAGKNLDIRVGLHFEFFQRDRFIVDNWAECGTSCPNETNQRVQGAVTVGFTPIRYMEIFAALYSSANRNERNHQRLSPGELNPNETPLQMALGDFLFGLRGRYPVAKFLSLGAQLGIKFLTSHGRLKPDFGATNVGFHGLMSVDFRKIHNKVPLAVHLNLGYLYDASSKLVDNDIYKDPEASSEYHHYFLVQQFALGLNNSRFQWGLGFEVKLPHLATVVKNARYMRWFPELILEIGMDVATGKADPDISEWLEFQAPGGSFNIDGRIATRFTAGMRFKPVGGLVMDIGVDVAVSNMGFAMGPPLAPWNLFFQAGYVFAPQKEKRVVKTKVEFKEVTKYIVKTPKPTKGRIRGVVTDNKTKAPLAQAIITFVGQAVSDVATAEDGTYMSFEFKVGKIRLEVRKEGYKPWSGEAVVAVGKVTPVNVGLDPEPPKVGKLTGSVISSKGGGGIAATVTLDGPEKKTVNVGADGAFTRTLKPGSYTVTATAPKHFTKRSVVVIEAGQKALLELKMTYKPRKLLVKITRTKIRIRRKVHFATGKADIRPDSHQLLDQVAAIMNEHPEIVLVRVEGHTDNRGGYRYNMKLSNDRANSVRDYLVSQGVDPNRLVAKGYGPKRPLVPNFSARNRRRNRRVEFRILKRRK